MSRLIKTRLFAIALFVAGAGGVALGLQPILALRHALHARALLIVWSARDPVGLPLGAGLILIAPLCWWPMPEATRGRRSPSLTPLQDRMARIGLGGMIVCLVLASLTPMVAEIAARSSVESSGYVACPPVDERHARDRWALPAATGGVVRCPGSWEESDRMEAAPSSLGVERGRVAR